MAENVYNVESLSIAELRKMAALMKIESQKDWDKSMYINAINTRRKSKKVCRAVEDPNSDDIPVGYCRIRLHLTPEGADHPVDVLINNFKTALPRNVWWDVPKEVRNTLRDATELVPRVALDAEGRRVVKMVSVPCYPFDTAGEVQGESGAIRSSTDIKKYRLREKYREMYGRWPRREEFAEFEKQFIDEYQKKALKEAVESDEME